MSEMDLSREMTRRAALARFSALAVGAMAVNPFVASAVAAPDEATAQRRATFAALVSAYDRAGSRSWIDARGRDAAKELAARYNAAPAEARDFINALLDAVEAAPSAGPFSALTLTERRKVLRGWALLQEPQDRLMYRIRETDARLPAGLRESNDRAVVAIRERLKTLPPDALKLDPVTGLPNFQPATAPAAPITDGAPLATEVRQLRALRAASFRLVASFFTEDPRTITDEALA